MEFKFEGLKNIFIVSNDAGAAHLLSSFLKKRVCGKADTRVSYCLQGPAVDIFQRKLGSIELEPLAQINTLSPATDAVFTGRSAVSSLEREAIKLARARGVRSATFLDHWDCYEDSFIGPSSAGEVSDAGFLSLLPDEVVVGDEYALELTKKTRIPGGIVRYWENEYFKEITDYFRLNSRNTCGADSRVLFLCEPTSDILKAMLGKDGGEWGYNELDVLNDFLRSAEKFRKLGFSELLIRPHPAERPEKYESVLKAFSAEGMKAEISRNRLLEEDILRSGMVVGTESMGLVVAILAGKQAVSYLPRGSSKKCSLPHKELLKIEDFNTIERLKR